MVGLLGFSYVRVDWVSHSNWSNNHLLSHTLHLQPFNWLCKHRARHVQGICFQECPYRATAIQLCRNGLIILKFSVCWCLYQLHKYPNVTFSPRWVYCNATAGPWHEARVYSWPWVLHEFIKKVITRSSALVCLAERQTFPYKENGVKCSRSLKR